MYFREDKHRRLHNEYRPMCLCFAVVASTSDRVSKQQTLKRREIPIRRTHEKVGRSWNYEINLTLQMAARYHVDTGWYKMSHEYIIKCLCTNFESRVLNPEICQSY